MRKYTALFLVFVSCACFGFTLPKTTANAPKSTSGATLEKPALDFFRPDPLNAVQGGGAFIPGHSPIVSLPLTSSLIDVKGSLAPGDFSRDSATTMVEDTGRIVMLPGDRLQLIPTDDQVSATAWPLTVAVEAQKTYLLSTDTPGATVTVAADSATIDSGGDATYQSPFWFDCTAAGGVTISVSGTTTPNAMLLQLPDYFAHIKEVPVPSDFVQAASIPAVPRFTKMGLAMLGGDVTNTIADSNGWEQWTNSNTNLQATEVTDPNNQTGYARQYEATSDDGTILHPEITSPLGQHTFSVWAKLKSGSGNVSITLDGTTWTPIPATYTWERYSKTQEVENPTPGLKFGTNQDKVQLFGANLTATQFLAPYIPTNGSPKTQKAEFCSWQASPELLATFSSAGSLYAEITTPFNKVAEFPANEGLVSSRFNPKSLLYWTNFSDTGARFYTHDSTNGPNYARNLFKDTTYKAAVVWGGADFSLSTALGHAWSPWRTTAFDGAYDSSSTINLARANEFPFIIRNLVFYDSKLDTDLFK